jgi:enterochelin esterase-like enzyme
MSLTGPIFLDGIIALTLAAFVAVVWLWPRLTRRTPWHIAGRVGSLALVNVMVLLTAATQLNAAYLFYSGWSDLRGSFTGQVAQTTLHRGGREERAADIAVAGPIAPVAAHVPPLTEPVSSTGQVSFTVHGPLSGLTGTVVVQLPPGYTSPANADQSYPVIEAFHGYPGSPYAWQKAFHIRQYVDSAVSAHALRPSLIVSPQIEMPAGVDTEGVNGQPDQPQVETWLTRDVPDWLGQHFRVDPDRNGWTTIGYSAGGWVAAMATVLHPAQYGAGIVMGGYFRPDFGPRYRPFTAGSPQGRRYDLARTAALRRPPVALWVQTSHADSLSYGTSAAFLRATQAPTAVHAVVLRNAGHRISVWVRLLPEALRWLGHNVQGFSPAGGPAQDGGGILRAEPGHGGAAAAGVTSTAADLRRGGHRR